MTKMIVLKLHVSTCDSEAAVPVAPVLVRIASAFGFTGHVLFYQESSALQKSIVIIRDTQPTVSVQHFERGTHNHTALF